MSFQLVICANLAEVLKSSGLTSLLDAANSVGLGDTLTKEGPFTIFAPTNEAFRKLPDGWDVDRGIQRKHIYSSDSLYFLSDSDALKSLLLYHIVSGIVKSSDAANNAGLTSLDGGTIRINVYLRLGQTKTMQSIVRFFMPLHFFRSDFYPSGIITANGKKVMAADIKADNGLVHVIEDVFFPKQLPTVIDVLVSNPMYVTALTLCIPRMTSLF
jgi:uncharacterized surface protein with fasciclin (FAS1) repeats